MDLTLCLSEPGGALGKAAAHPVIDSCWSDSNHGREEPVARGYEGFPHTCMQLPWKSRSSAPLPADGNTALQVSWDETEGGETGFDGGGGGGGGGEVGRWDEMSSWYWHLERSGEWVRLPPVCTVQPPRLHLTPPVGAAIPFQLHASQVEAQHSLKASVRLSACQSLCCCASILHSYTAPQSDVCGFNHICGDLRWELTKSSACCMKVTHKKCIFNKKKKKTVYMVQCCSCWAIWKRTLIKTIGGLCSTNHFHLLRSHFKFPICLQHARFIFQHTHPHQMSTS